jgi:hypothetical protein
MGEAKRRRQLNSHHDRIFTWRPYGSVTFPHELAPSTFMEIQSQGIEPNNYLMMIRLKFSMPENPDANCLGLALAPPDLDEIGIVIRALSARRGGLWHRTYGSAMNRALQDPRLVQVCENAFANTLEDLAEIMRGLDRKVTEEAATEYLDMVEAAWPGRVTRLKEVLKAREGLEFRLEINPRSATTMPELAVMTLGRLG